VCVCVSSASVISVCVCVSRVISVCVSVSRVISVSVCVSNVISVCVCMSSAISSQVYRVAKMQRMPHVSPQKTHSLQGSFAENDVER